MLFIYINLDRRPDRKDHIEKQFVDSHIDLDNVYRFRAIDGDCLQEYDVTLHELKLFKNADFKKLYNARYLIGNQLSHLRAMKHFLSTAEEYCVIMQDDMTFCRSFAQCVDSVVEYWPEDAEIVNIGFHKWAAYKNVIPHTLNCGYSDHAQTCVNKCICMLKNEVNPFSSAYVISRKGANAFISHVEKFGCNRATDWVMNEYLQSKKIFYGSREVLCTGALMGSDIFK